MPDTDRLLEIIRAEGPDAVSPEEIKAALEQTRKDFMAKPAPKKSRAADRPAMDLDTLFGQGSSGDAS